MENTKIISKITTKNYRNLVNEDGIALNNLNILIGSNGSGKSNLVGILEFLKNCLTPTSDLDSRGITAFQNALSKLGYNILDAYIDKPATVDLIFKFPYLHSSSGMEFNLSLFIDKSTVFINDETLINLNHDTKSELSFYYRSHLNTLGRASVFIKSEKPERYSLTELEEIPTNELSLIAIPKLLIEKGILSPEQIPLYKASRDLEDTVKKWQFYNANEMDLAKIRGERPKVGSSDVILATSGENLPAVLDNISNHIKYGLDFDERINNAMKDILPMTKRIKTSREGMSLTVRWYFDDMEEPFYLNDMSDGTVRMLCWATILHSPILPTLLVIDEPELSLHIAWMGILANWIKQASQKTQIIISTHSPDLLDYFTDCAGDVICFEKTQPKGHFKAQKLPEAIIKDKIAEGWQLGDLYRTGDDVIGGWPW
ncbi:MAG: AAA family ATPase [Methylobacter sp.]|nr:AAA family ATPase [Methylobacter sp.]MDP2098089.1 AAA family ATPase [Methylobacter sp.]MDP2430067.1 AAA family ATPase [Methylobacter sp.]MDP3056882.1 AAA family ATPase [Methylobacter sp.]MDP3364377.1 AAA family ATPase [Methylobacter sp.]